MCLYIHGFRKQKRVPEETESQLVQLIEDPRGLPLRRLPLPKEEEVDDTSDGEEDDEE